MQIYMHLIIFYVFQCLFTKKKRTLPSLEPFNVCLLVKIHRCYSNVQIREFSAVAICNKSNSRFNKEPSSDATLPGFRANFAR